MFFPLNSSEKIPVYNIPTDLFDLFPFLVYKGGQKRIFHVSQEPILIDHKLHELPGDWSRLRWVYCDLATSLLNLFSDSTNICGIQ